MDNYQRDTITYYDNNCKKYETEKHVLDDNFRELYHPFLERIIEGGKILDFGCGTGRDAKYFMENGYQVDALDGSREMCKIASDNIGKKVIHKNFLDFKVVDTYDGIWASASLLHLSTDDLLKVLKKLAKALKNNGYLYVSFKVGEFEGIRNSRYFNDMTEEKLKNLLTKVEEFELVDVYYNESTLVKQINKNWINFILKKKEMVKVLSLKEPFATLIKNKIKFVETRSWKTNYRGELYIHASITKSTLGHKNEDFMELVKDLSLSPGKIICKCKLVDCIYMTDKYIEDMKKNHYQEYICGRYEVGRYAWVLDDIEVLKEGMPAKGKLGIWSYFTGDKKRQD